MAYYNQNFYNRDFTFQNIPPPPVPPKFLVPPPITDQDFVKQFERNEAKVVKKMPSITQIKYKMRGLVLTLNDLKEKEKKLSEGIETLDDDQWDSVMKNMEENRSKIDETLLLLNDSCLESMRRALAKRTAKRLRLKRVKAERKREWEEMIKVRKENSRRIDEKLQKIKDDIYKVKMEEEAKLHADAVLREVHRRKHDARKCVTKLEALLRLRRARENTARGCGQAVPQADGDEFNSNVGEWTWLESGYIAVPEILQYMFNSIFAKLISLWNTKLSSYLEEEQELRSKLKESQPVASQTEDIVQTLQQWRQFLFGDEPQVDFKGDVGRFLAVRAQWDQYISNEGSSLPTGWAVP
ncbi:hypothetical protein MSG28_012090 [Choristoneura fumiferana]|uniref:Uncharacterized protein n=1 Tax=Choristoneura fumiferana TaxID=7141 RepID=A0ACC0KC24_CHOFU|nr:hypothetical protein MSG28_012090 [Choristoneura fumiferana]